MNLSSTQKVAAIVIGLLTVAGSLAANTWQLAQYAAASAAFDSTTVRRLDAMEQVGSTNRQMILLLGKANRFDVNDRRRNAALDEMEELDEASRFHRNPRSNGGPR